MNLELNGNVGLQNVIVFPSIFGKLEHIYWHGKSKFILTSPADDSLLFKAFSIKERQTMPSRLTAGRMYANYKLCCQRLFVSPMLCRELSS